MGWKKIFALIGIILVISISLEAGVSSSIGLQHDNLEEDKEDQIADSSWALNRGDRRNTGRSTVDTSHLDGGLEWGFFGVDGIFSEPTIGPDGTVYVGFMGRWYERPTLFALHPNGTEKWSFEGSFSMIDSSPAIAADGSLYFGIELTFYGLNQDGTEKWNYRSNDPIRSSPTIGEDGTIYAGLGEKLYAFEQDGTVKWNFTTYRISTSPAIGNEGTIYVASNNGNNYFIHAVNPNGTEKWNYSTEAYTFSPAVSYDGTVYATHGRNLTALNPDGTEKWIYETEDRVRSSATLAEHGTIYLGCQDGNLYAINQDGSEKWTNDISDRRVSSPVIGGDGAIYVGCWEGKIHALDSDGEKIWDVELPYSTGRIHTVIGEDGTLYAGSTVLYAIGEREEVGLTELMMDFLSKYWSGITLLLVLVLFSIGAIYMIKKSREKSSSSDKVELFEDVDMEKFKEEDQPK